MDSARPRERRRRWVTTLTTFLIVSASARRPLRRSVRRAPSEDVIVRRSFSSPTLSRMKDSTIRPGRRDVSARAQKVGTEPGRLPLYIKVAHALQHQIGAGEYPIGSLLPTEIELAKRHGVSRQTIRQAVQQLRQKKLLSAKKGVGTRVE